VRTVDERRLPRWVVFDLGETLVDETRNWGRWADHLAVPRLTFFAVMGAAIAARRPHTDAFDHFRPGFRMQDELAAKTAAGNGWAVSADDLYPDALAVLADLRRRGYRLAVMANQPLQAASFLATLPVDAVATSAEWGLAKPDPRFFGRISRTLGSAPADIAYVGDRVDNDVLPAKAAGMVAVHVRRGPWGVLHAEWPEAVDADARVDQLAELPAVLQGLGFLPRRGQPGRQ
jgi:FMN phosphatase YigB (HAD superfamily)